MTRVRIFACAGAGLALAALGWCLPDAQGVSAATVSRSAGLALLGIAMVLAGLVFRAAMRVGKAPAATNTRPKASEFRRGFDRKVGTKRAPARQPLHNGNVVELRRAVVEQAQRDELAPVGVTLPADEIERLQDMLHSRAAALRARNADQAKRRFLRSGVDVHGFARP